MVRKLPEILRSIKQSLILWKTTCNTIKSKVNILKSFALSKLIYHSYIEDFSDNELKEINNIIEWFLSAPNNNSKNSLKTLNLMKNERALYPMEKGGWNLWNIKNRQLAQKMWLINQFMDKYEKNNINSTHHINWQIQLENNNITSIFLKKYLQKWNEFSIKHSNKSTKALRNTKNEPLSLSEWYDLINNQNPITPKTIFQLELKLNGYSYNKLFSNILKIVDPKSKNTLFRFHSRCLPINSLHNNMCPLCKEPINNDPYGHLFFNCTNTRKFLNQNNLRAFLYKNSGKSINWTKVRVTKNNVTYTKIKYIIPEGAKKDHEVNEDYKNTTIHSKYFIWNYKAINFDLYRSFAYRNIIALIMHQLWIWLCDQLYNQTPKLTQPLNYEVLQTKWHKLATLEYLKRLKFFKLKASQDPDLFNENSKEFLENIKVIKYSITRDYCIKPTILPNTINFSTFI